MTRTVLRVSGSTKSVRAFLASTHWQPCSTYFRGELRAATSARKNLVSGFNLSVSNASGLRLAAQVRAAIKFLGTERNELKRLRALGLSGVLDFGVASKPEAMASFYKFPVQLLTGLASASLDLEVSYYGSQKR